MAILANHELDKNINRPTLKIIGQYHEARTDEMVKIAGDLGITVKVSKNNQILGEASRNFKWVEISNDPDIISTFWKEFERRKDLGMLMDITVGRG